MKRTRPVRESVDRMHAWRRIRLAREAYFARHLVPNVWHLSGHRAHKRLWRVPVFEKMVRVVSPDTKVSALRPILHSRKSMPSRRFTWHVMSDAY